MTWNLFDVSTSPVVGCGICTVLSIDMMFKFSTFAGGAMSSDCVSVSVWDGGVWWTAANIYYSGDRTVMYSVGLDAASLDECDSSSDMGGGPCWVSLSSGVGLDGMVASISNFDAARIGLNFAVVSCVVRDGVWTDVSSTSALADCV